MYFTVNVIYNHGWEENVIITLFILEQACIQETKIGKSLHRKVESSLETQGLLQHCVFFFKLPLLEHGNC